MLALKERSRSANGYERAWSDKERGYTEDLTGDLRKLPPLRF